MSDAKLSSTGTEQRILTAAIEAAAIHGVRRLSVSDVALRAGVSRPTLYKHYPSKDALVAGVVAHEARVFVEAVVAATEPFEDPRRAIEVAIVTTLRLAREHPLLDRIIQTEPETLLPLLTADGGPAVPAIRDAVQRVIEHRLPSLPEVARRRAADALTRLLVSYAVSAPDDPPEIVAEALSHLLVDGVGAITNA